jgi:hypothetical protein
MDIRFGSLFSRPNLKDAAKKRPATALNGKPSTPALFGGTVTESDHSCRPKPGRGDMDNNTYCKTEFA